MLPPPPNAHCAEIIISHKYGTLLKAEHLSATYSSEDKLTCLLANSTPDRRRSSAPQYDRTSCIVGYRDCTSEPPACESASPTSNPVDRPLSRALDGLDSLTIGWLKVERRMMATRFLTQPINIFSRRIGHFSTQTERSCKQT